MYKSKKYGQSMVTRCFCGRIATIKNKQGIPTCQSHRSSKLENLKCACNKTLTLQTGKWGPYFTCINCGNINFNKAMNLNPQSKPKPPKNPKEITITSDQLDFIY